MARNIGDKKDEPTYTNPQPVTQHWFRCDEIVTDAITGKTYRITHYYQNAVRSPNGDELLSTYSRQVRPAWQEKK